MTEIAHDLLILIFIALAVLSFGIGVVQTKYGRAAWPTVRRWWPFALARTVRQLRAKLHKAEQDNQKLRDRNEQLALENRSQHTELEQVKMELGRKVHENATLKLEQQRPIELGDTARLS